MTEMYGKLSRDVNGPACEFFADQFRRPSPRNAIAEDCWKRRTAAASPEPVSQSLRYGMVIDDLFVLFQWLRDE
jgi:hypothetical protein